MSIERVMVAPLNYSHWQSGQIDGFAKVFATKENPLHTFDYMNCSRNGMSTAEINRLFVEQVCEIEPDWIWLQVQGSNVLQPSAIEQIKKTLPKCLITHWMGDCRETVPTDLQVMCQVTHATLLSNVGQLDFYRSLGAPRAHYVQIGLDWDEDVLGLPEWKPPFRVPDVVFCGGFYGRTFERGTAERLEAIRALVAAGIDVGVVGTGWPKDIPVVGECHVKQQHHVYKRAKVALSINHFNDIELYYSDRQLIAMASGTPVVCRYVPGLEREFADFITSNEHYGNCIFWRTPSELVQHVRWMLQNPVGAKVIGKNGQTLVVAEHTWEARVLQLLPKVTQWQAEL